MKAQRALIGAVLVILMFALATTSAAAGPDKVKICHLKKPTPALDTYGRVKLVLDKNADRYPGDYRDEGDNDDGTITCPYGCFVDPDPLEARRQQCLTREWLCTFRCPPIP